MDAIILAAGRNDRLNGIVPAYMKPLLVVNGQTLVNQMVNNLGMCGRVVVVASPDNVKPLVDVVSSQREDARFVVQPQALGPADALSLGLDVVTSRYTLLLCGDNLIPGAHWLRLFKERKPEAWEAVISTRFIHARNVSRFTYFNDDGDVFEKEDPPCDDLVYRAWVGPLVFVTDALRKMFNSDLPPQSLSDLIRRIEPGGRIFVEGECSDIGVPGELP